MSIIRRQNARPVRWLRVELALERAEQVRPRAQARQRVLARQPVGVLAGPPLLAPDRHPDVGDEPQRDEVDADGRERGLDGGPTASGVEATRRGRRAPAPAVSSERRARRHDDRRPDDDQRQGERERAHGAAGERDQHAGQHGPIAPSTSTGASRGSRRHDLVEDEQRDRRDRQEHEDRALLRGPQVGDGDDRRDGEHEDPRRDPDHPVRGRRAGGRTGALDSGAAQRRRSVVDRAARRVASSAGVRRAARPQPLTRAARARRRSARGTRSARSKQREQCVDRHVFPPRAAAPGRVRASYPGRPILPLRHMPHPVRAVTAWPPINGVLGPSAAPGGTAGRAVTARVTPSAGPDGQRVPHW